MNKELKKMYLEFLSLNENTDDYIKYSYFFSLYFNSHDIPNEVLEIYRKNNGKDKTILDFKSSFSGTIFDIIDKKKETVNKSKITKLTNKINEYSNEKKILVNILSHTIELISLNDDNIKLNINLSDYKKELRKSKISDRKKVKSKINEINELIIPVNIDNEIDNLEKEYNELYVTNYGEGVIDFTNLTTLRETLLERINEINNVLTTLNNDYKLVTKNAKNTNYNIDLSDLYDRLGC